MAAGEAIFEGVEGARELPGRVGVEPMLRRPAMGRWLLPGVDVGGNCTLPGLEADESGLSAPRSRLLLGGTFSVGRSPTQASSFRISLF